MNFYYFVASQPALGLGDPAPFSLAEYRAEVTRLLPAGAAKVLSSLLDGAWADVDSEFVRAWLDADTQIRNAVARTRGSRSGVESAGFLRAHTGFSLYFDQGVAEAFGKANPLERELTLDRLRWAVLEDLAGANPFGLEAVLAYGLKLRLVERWAGLADEAGQAALQAAVKQVREAALV